MFSHNHEACGYSVSVLHVADFFFFPPLLYTLVNGLVHRVINATLRSNPGSRSVRINWHQKPIVQNDRCHVLDFLESPGPPASQGNLPIIEGRCDFSEGRPHAYSPITFRVSESIVAILPNHISSKTILLPSNYTLLKLSDCNKLEQVASQRRLSKKR